MDLSWVILICGAATIVIGLIFVFLGYKLARFLLPLCGVMVGIGLVWAFVLDALQLNAMETWLFMGGVGVSLYILLFFFKRVAAFFAGLLGAALILLYTATAFGLDKLPYLYPACLTLSVASGLLALVYKKAGVITFTALFGACVAAFAGLYLYFQGVNAGAFSGNVLVPLEAFLSAYKYLITGVALVVTVAGILVQTLITSQSQVLSGPLRDERSSRPPRSEDAQDAPPSDSYDPPRMSV